MSVCILIFPSFVPVGRSRGKDTQVVLESTSLQILVSKLFSNKKNQGSLETWLIPVLAQGEIQDGRLQGDVKIIMCTCQRDTGTSVRGPSG